MNREPAPCGTYGAYQRHVRRGEEPCQPCRDANAAYMRELRTDPENHAKALASNAARHRALERLAAEHPRHFLELLNEERKTVYARAGRSS